MLYEEAKVYLDHVSKYGSVLGLESIKGLLGELQNPQDHLQFIHIAGTNGKGSILAYLSTVLKEAGFVVGRYISPTVTSYLERFQINGNEMSEEEFSSILEEVKLAAERVQEKGNPSPTVFEIETAVAFVYFAKHNCDYVVLETGLGGRLDATNVVKNTKVCVFSSISKDHMGVLGNTLTEIAEEKAGIMKAGAAVVSAVQPEEVMRVLEAHAEHIHTQVCVPDQQQIQITEETLDRQCFSYKEYLDLVIHLAGRNQIENAVTALEVIRTLKAKGVQISEQAVRNGMEKTSWPGRFQVLGKSPLLILDGAHNEGAAERLAENIETYLHGEPVVAVMGVFQDKEYQKIIQIMKPYLDFVYTIDLPNVERTLKKEQLVKELEHQDVQAKACDSIEEAIKEAKKKAKEKQAVLVFGSLSYLGEVIHLEGGASESGEGERIW